LKSSQRSITGPAREKKERKPRLKLVAPSEPKAKRSADAAAAGLVNVFRLLVALQGDQALRYLELLQADA
jgi:hypothetical protein